MDRVALLLHLNMYSDSVFLFLCLRGPVPPASVLCRSVGGFCRKESVHLYIAVAIESSRKMKSECRFCGLTQLSAFQLYSFSSYYENILQICMIQRHEVCQYLWRFVLSTEALVWNIVKENVWSKPVKFLSTLYSAHKKIGRLLEYMGL